MFETFKQFCMALIGTLFCAAAVFSQSTDQQFPTPVTENVVESRIIARDIGDSRLTNYYFTFDGDQGDLFINIVTNNLTGDIDLFRLDDLAPITKISVYGDLSESETGRVVYLRKREKLLLRVQGRTPNDEPAIFRIKFAGSFIAANTDETEAQPELPTVKAQNKSGIVVNSIGTVIEGRKTDRPKAVVAKSDVETKPEPEAETIAKGVPIAENDKVAENKEPEKEQTPETETSKVEVVVTDNIKAETPKKTVVKSKTPKKIRRSRKVAEKPVAEVIEEKAEAAKVQPKETEKPAVEENTPAKTLASIRLVVLFKDGSKIERPMNEVLRFTVDDGVLTIISKDGRIGRYSIFDVEKTTIE